MHEVPSSVDLSCGRSPEEFFVCLIPDRMKVEEWRASKNAFNYSIPSSSWCAMTCVRMVLLLENREAPSLDELFERACARGVYRQKADHPGWWLGAYHESLLSFVRGLNLHAHFQTGVTTSSLVRALADGYYCVMSVSSETRHFRDTEPEKKSGHFILLYKYDSDENGTHRFWIQNGSGYASENSQIGVMLTEARIAQVFSGRALLVRSSQHS